MTSSRAEEEDGLREKHAAAITKIRVWRTRADQAQLAGRKSDADRCKDKARDWTSRAKQMEQQLAERLPP